MTDSLNHIKRLLDECTNEQQTALLDYLKARLPEHPLEREWGIGAEVILSAIERSPDLTKRGVRGIIAEAVLERQVLPNLRGWQQVSFDGNRPYDFLIRSTEEQPREARIQVKLQRLKSKRPMLASEGNRHYPGDMHVVEVQKTRGGIDPKTGADTRPYRFNEFDILAVNTHPSTHDWTRFLFTLSNWLLPRAENPALIEKFQPVPLAENDCWTDNLAICLHWLAAGEQKKIFDISPDLLKRRSRKPKPSRG